MFHLNIVPDSHLLGVLERQGKRPILTQFLPIWYRNALLVHIPLHLVFVSNSGNDYSNVDPLASGTPDLSQCIHRNRTNLFRHVGKTNVKIYWHFGDWSYMFNDSQIILQVVLIYFLTIYKRSNDIQRHIEELLVYGSLN